MSQQINLIVFENGYVSNQARSGGDLMFNSVLPFLSPNKFQIKIILPALASIFYQKQRKNAQFIFLPRDPFYNTQNRFLIFLNYLFRIYHSVLAVNKINCSNKILLYSATNTITDILPAYWVKEKSKKKSLFWAARIHHLLPPPFQRKGNIIINFIAYILEKISLYALKKADLILVLNPLTKKKLIKKGFPATKIKINPPGINKISYLISKNNKKEKLWTAIFIGRFHYLKGVYDLPLIWRGVLKTFPQAKLALVGEANPSNLAQLENKFQKLHISSQNYQYLGYLSEKDKVKHLQQSALFLFTDYEAGWGITIAEALAAGTPVIAYEHDFLTHSFGQAITTVPRGNTNKMAAAIIELLKKKNLYSQLQKKGQRISSKFYWSQRAQQLERILLQLMSNSQK